MQKGSDINENDSKSHERNGDREITCISSKGSDRLEQEGQKSFTMRHLKGNLQMVSGHWLDIFGPE